MIAKAQVVRAGVELKDINRKLDTHMSKKGAKELQFEQWVDNEKADKAQDFIDIENKKAKVEEQNFKLRMLKHREQKLIDK